MKKLYVLLIVCSCVFLAGCFKKNPPVVVDPNIPVIVDGQSDSDSDSDENEDEIDDDSDEVKEDDNRANEYDENGEFDPSKFEDDDIDEIMEIMKELIAE
jgi:hypothetical protein